MVMKLANFEQAILIGEDLTPTQWCSRTEPTIVRDTGAYAKLRDMISAVAVAAAPTNDMLWRLCREMLTGRLPLWGFSTSYPLASIGWEHEQRMRWLDILMGERYVWQDSMWDGRSAAPWHEMRVRAEDYCRAIYGQDHAGLRISAYVASKPAMRRHAAREYFPNLLEMSMPERHRFQTADRLLGSMLEVGIVDAEWSGRLFCGTRMEFARDAIINYITEIARPFYNKGLFSPCEYLTNVLRRKLPLSCGWSDHRTTRFMPVRVLGKLSDKYACDEERLLVQGFCVTADDRVSGQVVTMAMQKGDWIARRRAPIGQLQRRPA